MWSQKLLSKSNRSEPEADRTISILLKSSGSQVTPASLLQFHEPDDSGFDDLRLRDQRDIFRLSSCHILARIPTCRKGELWHGFGHGFDARFNGGGVIPHLLHPRSSGDPFHSN